MRPDTRSATCFLTALLAALYAAVPAVGAVTPSVVELAMAEIDPPPPPEFQRRAGCKGILDAGGLVLHCAHDFDTEVTLVVSRRSTGEEVLRTSQPKGDFYLTLLQDGGLVGAVRSEDLRFVIFAQGRTVAGNVQAPTAVTGGSLRLELPLETAAGTPVGSCTAILTGQGVSFLFDFYIACSHELGEDAVAALYDRTPGSVLPTGPDGLLAPLGNGLLPVRLDWRIQDGRSPVGGFVGGTFELVVSNGETRIAAALDGCLAGGETVCMLNRFAVRTRWTEPYTGERLVVPGTPVTFSDRAALFSFQDPATIGAVVQIADRCAGTGFYSVAVTGISSWLEPVVVVEDTITGQVEEYATSGGSAPATGRRVGRVQIVAQDFPCTG